MFTKYYRNCQVITIAWVYLPKKICGTTHATINIFRICPEFQYYYSHSDRYQKRKNITLGEKSQTNCIMSDNPIAISYINHMDENKSARCNDIRERNMD